jgi:MATE family multidrug resistance protein
MTPVQSRGGIRHVFLFSLPVIMSQACDSLMMFTDRYLLAQVDSLLPTASMSGGMTAFLLWVFGVGLLSFTTPLVSQYKGANEASKANTVVIQGLILSVFLAAPLLIWGQKLAHFYFTFLRLPEAEFPLALQYLSVIIHSCLFVFFKVVFAGFFSGIGKTKLVMAVNIAGLLLNMPLSYFLIHGGLGENWQGVRGAALGTVCAEIFMSVLYAILFLRSYAKNVKWSFSAVVFKKLLLYGAPIGAEFFALTFAFNTLITMFHSFGLHAAQAMTVTMNWSWLTILPFLGLNVGVMSLVGHAMGEGNPSLAEQITKSAITIAFGIVALASFAFLAFTDLLIEAFGITQDLPAFALAQFMIRTLPLYCLFDALSFVFTACLRASGDTQFCLKVGAVGHWACLLLCFYGTYYGGFSPLTIWGFFILTLFGQSIGYGWRYLRGSWKKLRVVDTLDYRIGCMREGEFKD